MTTNYLSIKKKLLLGVLGISTLVTTCITAITFYLDYKQEMNEIESALNSIQMSLIKPLTQSIWNFNEQQLKSQLESLIQIPFISSVELSQSENEKNYHYKNELHYSTNQIETYKYPLMYKEDNGSETILGELKINVTTQHIKNKLTKKFIVYFSLQLAKTILLSYLLLLLFQRLVTRHIDKIRTKLSHYQKENFTKVNPIKIYKSTNHHKDELTELTDVINTMAEAVSMYNKKMILDLQDTKKNLEDERARSLYSSKMAALGEMSSGIAHEINNPLSIMILKLNQLKKITSEVSEDKKEDYEKNVLTLLKLTDKIAKIVRGLKNFSREGSRDPFIPTSINSIIEDTQLLVSEKIKKFNVDFTIPSIQEELLIECRSSEISQVLINLISNAADAIKNNNEKWIKLELNVNEEQIQFTITDSGNGIPEDVANKIMQPFFTTKPIGEGTGLGLSISKGLIEHHGGTLELNPHCQNTQFIIKLPTKQKNEFANKQLA